MYKLFLICSCFFMFFTVPLLAEVKDPNVLNVYLDSFGLVDDGSKDVSIKFQKILDGCVDHSRLIISADKHYSLGRNVTISKPLTVTMGSGSSFISAWRPRKISLDGLLQVESKDVNLNNININGMGHLHRGIVVRDSERVKIYGGYIYNTGVAGLKIASSKNCIIERVRFNDCGKSLVGVGGRDGVVVVGKAGWTTSKTSDSEHITIKDVLVTNPYMKAINIGFSNHCTVTNCTVINGVVDANISGGLYAGYGAKNTSFSDCTVSGTGSGVKVSSGALNTNITNCILSSFQHVGIYIQGGINTTVSKCEVEIEGNQNGIIVAAHPQIGKLKNGSNCINTVIEDNTIVQKKGSGTSGILIENHAGKFYANKTFIKRNRIEGFDVGIKHYAGPDTGAESEITNNIIMAFKSMGISVRWNAENVLISGNVIKSSIATAKYGINLDFKPNNIKQNFALRRNQIEVTNGTCIQIYCAGEISIKDNRISGRTGIDCGGNVSNVICRGNHIEGIASNIGIGIKSTDSKTDIEFGNNVISKFAVGVLAHSQTVIKSKVDNIYNCDIRSEMF